MRPLTTPIFGKVVIFGVGLIGGSFALALKAAGAVEEIVGFGRRPASLRVAAEHGILDRLGLNIPLEVSDADIVLVSTPVGQMADLFASIAPHIGPQTVVTDGGSTKMDVEAAARAAFAERISQFVPAHPVAGAEQSGPSAARANLYQQKKVVITPLPENSDETLDRVKQAWAMCGADIFELSPLEHDQVFAAVSHLPHLLSFALVHDIARRENAAELFSFAASGFRDFTRIAASHPEMWRDICLANREPLLLELDRYTAALSTLKKALEAEDGEGLEAVFSVARTARQAWGENQ